MIIANNKCKGNKMADNKQKYGVLENVVLAYVKVAEPTTKYQSTDLEYSVDAIVEKSVAKQWNKDFPKQKAKELEKDEFESKYKMEAPFEGDDIFVIKLKKAATKNGVAFDEKFRPRLLVENDEGERTDVTVSRLCSNGVKAKVSYRITENDFGRFGQLNNILVKEDDFIEYVSQAAGAGSEFGGKVAKVTEPENKIATEARASKAEVKAKPAHVDEKDDDAPF